MRERPIPELLDQGVEGVPAEQTHCPEPPVDRRTLWLLQPAEDLRLFLFYHLDYREYIFETLLLLGVYYPTGSLF